MGDPCWGGLGRWRGQRSIRGHGAADSRVLAEEVAFLRALVVAQASRLAVIEVRLAALEAAAEPATTSTEPRPAPRTARRALGRGLDALIPAAGAAPPGRLPVGRAFTPVAAGVGGPRAKAPHAPLHAAIGA